MTYRRHIILPVAALLLFTCAEAQAGGIKLPWKKKKAETEKVDTVKKKTTYEKLIEKEKCSASGLMTLHLKGGKLYAEIPDSLMGREFLMGTTIKSISDNKAGIVGAKEMSLLHFTLTKADSTVYVRKVDDSMVGAGKTLDAISRSFKIKTVNADTTAVVVDVTDMFMDDDKTMSPFLATGMYSSMEKSESYKKDLSYIVGMKSFSDNLSVTVSKSYTVTLKSGGRTTLKDAPLTAELTSSIILLPKEPYRPRPADPRIGYFYSQKTTYGSLTESSRTVYYTHRWRLEPSDMEAWKAGKMVEPVKPIVFYIDSEFPDWWKPYIEQAVNDWSRPFEKIGFKNAVIAKFFPTPEEDPAFDPDNIKYNCIRYAPISIQNAMGPSWVDPRSGEIINASVYVYHDVIRLVNDWMYVQTAQADEAVRGYKPNRERLGDALLYVIRHEVGHTMGLMHNMGASSSIPVEALRDPGFTQENGTTYSIMDYARFNYVAQPGDMEKGVKLTPPDFGKYDYYAIRWAYTPVEADSIEEEGRITSAWISDSLKTDALYRYGIQQVYSSFFDPRNQTEDLSDDVLAASSYGVDNLKYIMKGFMDWIGPEDEEYEFRSEIYKTIANQYLRYAGHVAKNVGGLYRNEVKDGDPYKPFENVPAAKQKACLERLFQMWEDTEWLSDSKVLSRLPVIGSPETAVKEAIQSQILSTPLSCSLSDGVATREFSAQQALDFIYDKVWAPTRQGKKLNAAQRSFQKDFVERLMKTCQFKTPSSKSKSFSEDYQAVEPHGAMCCSSHEDECLAGELLYSPVAGFGWLPRYSFNQGEFTQAMGYASLMKARDLMRSRLSGATGEDKAHYTLLIETINYSLK